MHVDLFFFFLVLLNALPFRTLPGNDLTGLPLGVFDSLTALTLL